MKYIFAALIAGATLFGGIFLGHEQARQAQPVSFGAFTPVQAAQFTLAGAGINNSQNTIQLASFLLPDPAKTPIQMSMFGSIGYGVIDPQTSKIENISFTGVTQNSNGSATLTGVSRGLSFYAPYAASTTLSLSHAGGATFILSNSGAFYGQQFLFANNVGSSTATLTYSNTAPPFYWPGPGAQSTGSAISTTSEFASVAYVNAISTSGAPNASTAAKGIVQLATALQAASTTALGSTGASLAITSAIATDTPQSGCSVGFTSIAGAGCTIIADLTGHIKQGWISLTQLFTFSGGLTSTATTTLAGSNVLSNALKINGVPYSFQSTQGASSTQLTEDGNGNLTWEPGHLRYSAYNTAGISKATTGYATTSLLTIPANVMNASSTIEIKGNATCTFGASTGGICTFRVRSDTGAEFGNFTIASKAQGTSGSDESGYFDFMILPNNSVAVQQTIYNSIVIGLDFSGGGSTAALIGNRGGGSAGTSAINLANATTIDMVVQSADGNETAFVSGLSVIVQQ